MLPRMFRDDDGVFDDVLRLMDRAFETIDSLNDVVVEKELLLTGLERNRFLSRDSDWEYQ